MCLDGPHTAVHPRHQEVSIPQSGFGVFGQIQINDRRVRPYMFQSLSRDSVCLDLDGPQPHSFVHRFQSLSRDSVCLDNTTATPGKTFSIAFQSLSRDSVCLDCRPEHEGLQLLKVFQSLSRDSVCLD